MPRLNAALLRALDTNANPSNGALFYLYQAGTSTPVTTYADAALTTPQNYPVAADAAGIFPTIYAPYGTYKVVVKTIAGVTLDETDDFVISFSAPLYETIASMAVAAGFIDGQPISVANGKNGEQENFTYVEASTLTADGALVVDATGMGAGRLISQRTTFASYAEMLADVRPHAVGTKLRVEGIGSATVVGTGGDTANAGGTLLSINRAGSGYDLRMWGVVVDDDTAAAANVTAITAAMDKIDGKGTRTLLTCPGKITVNDELFAKTDAIGGFLTFRFLPTGPNKACLNVGTKDGAYLVRNGGWKTCLVDCTGTTQVGTVAFSFGHGARASFINDDCRAIMNNNGGAGSTTTDYGHIGFQMLGVRPDLKVTLQGAYQNKMQGSCFNAKYGLYLDTEGFGQVGYAPEMNGNSIDITCYSCRVRGALIGEGAQENNITLRADTFIDQKTQGTTVAAVEVRGSYNHIHVEEEIGDIADVQHTVLFSGSNARYNHADYNTQQVVTSAVSDATTGSAVAKNTAKNIGRPQGLGGGDTFTASGYAVVAAGATSVVTDSVVIPRNCVLVRAVAENVNSPASFTRFYFAKNGVTNTVNRLTWSSADTAGTRKSKVIDPTAAGTISNDFIYVDGDVVDIKFDQDATAGNSIRWTLFFKVLQ